jgi:HK97 family phage major capsid protein
MPKFPFDSGVFVSESGASAAEVAEGAGVPFSQGAWTIRYLRRRRFAGMIAQSRELILSGDLGTLLALSTDLTSAVAEAVDRALLSPDATGSVFDGQTEITATGTSGAQLTADLLALTNAVPTAYLDGRFVMPQKTAAFLATVNTSGVRFFPEIGVNGGRLLGLPVEISAALGQPGSPPTACIGLVSPSMVLHALDERVGLEVSERSTIQINAAPTMDSSDGTAGTANLVSLWQAGAAAVKGTIYADFFARPGAGAFCRVGF